MNANPFRHYSLPGNNKIHFSSGQVKIFRTRVTRCIIKVVQGVLDLLDMHDISLQEIATALEFNMLWVLVYCTPPQSGKESTRDNILSNLSPATQVLPADSAVTEQDAHKRIAEQRCKCKRPTRQDTTGRRFRNTTSAVPRNFKNLPKGDSGRQAGT